MNVISSVLLEKEQLWYHYLKYTCSVEASAEGKKPFNQAFSGINYNSLILEMRMKGSERGRDEPKATQLLPRGDGRRIEILILLTHFPLHYTPLETPQGASEWSILALV